MLEVEISQGFAVDLVGYACGRYTGGRSESDPVYKKVTENRDVGAMQATYSSCGDLAHWLLYRLGSRAKFINREEHLGWRPGLNVSKLAFSPLAEEAAETDIYEPGDILIIWSKLDATDAHVMVALHHEGNQLTSGEYGQPGGKIRDHVLTKPGWIGTRKLHRVIRLQKVLKESEARGELKEPDYTTLPLAQAYLSEHSPKHP